VDYPLQHLLGLIGDFPFEPFNPLLAKPGFLPVEGDAEAEHVGVGREVVVVVGSYGVFREAPVGQFDKGVDPLLELLLVALRVARKKPEAKRRYIDSRESHAVFVEVFHSGLLRDRLGLLDVARRLRSSAFVEDFVDAFRPWRFSPHPGEGLNSVLAAEPEKLARLELVEPMTLLEAFDPCEIRLQPARPCGLAPYSERDALLGVDVEAEPAVEGLRVELQLSGDENPSFRMDPSFDFDLDVREQALSPVLREVRRVVPRARAVANPIEVEGIRVEAWRLELVGYLVKAFL